MTRTPRMRTIVQAVEEMKQVDPGTAITVHALRRMVKSGTIPHVRAGNKQLVNVDTINEYLMNPVPVEPVRGQIRAIPEQRA